MLQKRESFVTDSSTFPAFVAGVITSVLVTNEEANEKMDPHISSLS